MNDIERLLIEARIERLVHDYWHEVDSNWGANCPDFFTEDCTFSKMRGKAEVKTFYDWRRGRGERASFHLVMNMKVNLESPDRAVARYVMMLYGKDGTPPLDVTAPNTISDAVEVFVRQPDGWKVKSKTLTVIFKSDEPTTSIPIEVLEKTRTA